MIRFYKTPAVVKWIYPSRMWKLESSDTIYLTFDDGPDPEVTPWVLEELKKADAKATFFCVGRKVSANPNLIERQLKEGHLIANHTFSHLNGWGSSKQHYLEECSRCDLELEKIGVRNTLFRPPYGKMTSAQARSLKKQIIMWSHLSWDFDPSLNRSKALSILKKAKPGSIITFHDSLKAYENLRALLPELLEHFRDRNLNLATLTQ